MNKIIYRITLDMFEVTTQTTIKAKKGDTACSIIMTLADKGKIYNITEGCYAVFSAKKPDGNYLFNGETCYIKDNTIVYDFTDQTATCEGPLECEVILYKGENRLTSPRFILLVDDTVYNGEEIFSSPEADAFNKLYNDVQTALKNGEFKGDKGADGTVAFEDLTEEQKASLKGDKGEVDYAVVDNAILEVLVVFDLAPMLLDADGAVLCDKNDEILVNM